jgi:ribosomal protein S18 acetylase RimI-like enzyme
LRWATFKLRLRRATPGDASELNRLARAAYARHVAAIGREPQPMATDWATLFDTLEIWALDGPDGIEASLALEPGDDALTIWSVAVAPPFQGTGLGSALLGFAEERAAELGRPEIRLFTNARMAGNVELYAGKGYHETRREILPDRTVVYMAKRL